VYEQTVDEAISVYQKVILGSKWYLWPVLKYIYRKYYILSVGKLHKKDISEMFVTYMLLVFQTLDILIHP